MSDDILAVCQSITDAAVAASPELRPYPTLRDAVSSPAIVVLAGDPFITYHQRMGGLADAFYTFDVVLLASKANEVVAQQRLYGWLNPRNGLYQAIDALPGMSVVEAVNVGDYGVGTATLWGGTLRVTYDG